MFLVTLIYASPLVWVEFYQLSSRKAHSLQDPISSKLRYLQAKYKNLKELQKASKSADKLTTSLRNVLSRWARTNNHMIWACLLSAYKWCYIQHWYYLKWKLYHQNPTKHHLYDIYYTWAIPIFISTTEDPLR